MSLIPGADTGFEVRGDATLFEAGVWAAWRPPVGTRAKPWWGSRGRSPRKLLYFRDFIGLENVFQEVNLLHFCHHEWGKIHKMTQTLKMFQLKYKFSL
jgi:hypothetical protein